MIDLGNYSYPKGLKLLKSWQAGDAQARKEIRQVFDAAISGKFDDNFSILAPENEVHSTASVHMLALAILHDLYGINSSEYYKTNPYRYVRSNLTVSRLLGAKKLYMTWALYAFSCEVLGQQMMYPDKFPPGSDPDTTLLNKSNCFELKTPDFTCGIPKIIDDVLRATEELTGMEPLLQISAPYSLAADIYGQEPLLADVVNDPTHVNALLDHLANKVIIPWIEHHMSVFPNGWVELSDASGSPFFIGPENCKSMSIRSIQQMDSGKLWNGRVFDCNYRGDFVANVKSKERSNRRTARKTQNATKVDLIELTDLKYSVCQKFMMRLEADKIDVSFYRDQSLQRNIPLTTGIGSGEIDRNSIDDFEVAKNELRSAAKEYVSAIKDVCEKIDLPPNNFVNQPWPSHLYFEDVNGETDFELIEIILEQVYSCPKIERTCSN